MSIYIGGDTESLEFDFGLKVANSVAECPMKIYKGEVDPDALPAPTDALWKEVTSQSVLDKLKSQNELLTSNLAVDKSTIAWGDKTLSKTSVVKVVDDFVGKVSGSVVINPNIAKHNYGRTDTTLISPSQPMTEYADSGYPYISSLGNGSAKVETNSIGSIAQSLFSFNILEIFERKYGSIPRESISEKIEWLKKNLSKIVPAWYGYGSCPTGNKAYLSMWDGVSAWIASLNNTSSSPSVLAPVYSNESQIGRIDSNGFVHFLAYTDKARTTDETLLVLTGHGLINGSIIENTTRGLDSTIDKGTDNTVILRTSITGQVGGDSIKKYKLTLTKTAELGTDSTILKITNHGLATGDYIKNGSLSYARSKITVVDANTISCNTPITGQASGNIIEFYPLIGTQTAEFTVIPSTIYTDYVSIELTLKAPENMITATNTLEDIVTDYSGKVSGSLVENANKSYTATTTTLSAPSSGSFIETSQLAYDLISILNGSSKQHITSTNGQIAQQLFSFDIVKAVEKHLGQPIPAVDKVAWCKNNLRRLDWSWYGYGSSPLGNKAYLKVWRVDTSNWTWENNNTASSPQSTPNAVSDVSSLPLKNCIDANGFLHLVTYTDASDGITPSTIYTDYVKLTIKLKYLPTYDFYTDSNTRRDAGLTNIVLVKRQIGDMTSDFSGKVSGSVVENPNIFKHNGGGSQTSLIVPNSFSIESSNGGYTNISTLNGTNATISTTVNGAISQSLFQFNLIAIAEKQLGTSIPGADVASKISWLVSNLANIRTDWYGYGSCPSGNKAYFTYFRYGTTWQTTNSISASSPSIVTWNLVNFSEMIDTSGFVNFLAYTDASDGNTASVINTDYIKLTLTFKTDTIGYEYFTNNSSEISVTTNNKASAFLIEADLTSIANALYGGSNSALKAALKSISADVWAMGSGSNVNQLGYGVKLITWHNGSSQWGSTIPTNTTSTIAKINRTVSNQNDSAWITTDSNKLYYVICSTYKSDGSIPSECNLDYVNIKVNLARIPDVVSNPPTINLTDTWSILMKGLSPSWSYTDYYTLEKFFLRIYKDNDNYIAFKKPSNTNGEFRLYTISSAISSAMNSANTFSKYQVTNALISQKNDGKIYLTYLLNNGTIKTINVTNKMVNGLYDFQILGNGSACQADAFLDTIAYFPNKTFTDVEAEGILRGTTEGFENPNLVPLFNDSRWTKHANATVSSDGKTLTLNATANYQFSYVDIPILPNNKYKITSKSTTNVATTQYAVYMYSYCNNSNLDGSKNNMKNDGTLKEVVFTTSNKTNRVRVYCSNDNTGTGTFTFSDISLKRLD